MCLLSYIKKKQRKFKYGTLYSVSVSIVPDAISYFIEKGLLSRFPVTCNVARGGSLFDSSLQEYLITSINLYHYHILSSIFVYKKIRWDSFGFFYSSTMQPVIYAVLLIVYLVLKYFIPFLNRVLFSPKSGTVNSVSKSLSHSFSKSTFDQINLIAGLGVEGDSHLGVEVQHLSRRHITPNPPNLRQVHLIHSELFDELKVLDKDGKSYDINPGDLGENIMMQGLDVLSLSVGTRLRFINNGEDGKGKCAIVRVSGLRNPCPQISKFQDGLLQRCLDKDEAGKILERKTGIMSVVEAGGVVKKGAKILVYEPWVFKKMDMV